MFNEINKLSFLNSNVTSDATRKGYITLFRAIEPYESEYGIDVCAMDPNTISKVLDETTGARLQGKMTRISLLRKYVKWCVDIGYPNAKYNLDGVILGTEKLRRRTVKSPEELQQYLNAVFDKESEDTVDNIYRAYMWLAYCGLGEEDIFKITISDVDLSELTVQYKCETIQLYEQSRKAIEKCVNNKTFVYNHPLYNATIKYRADGDTLIRGFKQTTAIIVRAYLARRTKQAVQNKQTGLELSYTRVWLAGLFYRMYNEELMNGFIDYEKMYALIMSNKSYEHSGSESEHTRKNRIIKKYIDDYQLWKEIKMEDKND